MRNIDFVLKKINYHGLWGVDTKREVKTGKTIITSGGIHCKILWSKTITGTFLGKFLLKFLKPYVCCFIYNANIKEKEVHKVNNFNNYYHEILYELGGSKLEDPFWSVGNLEKKIKDFSENKIKI